MQLKIFISSLLLVSVYCSSSRGRHDRIRPLSDMIKYPETQESYFRTNKLYTFQYDGQINIGVPDHSEQQSASRIQAEVMLVKRSDDHFILRCRNVRIGKQLSRIQDPRQIQPFDQFEQTDVSTRQISTIELPVEFTYAEGQIQDLVFQQQEEEWSANMKRGIINMLQIKLQPKDRVSMEEEQSALNKLDTESKTDIAQVYRTNEKTVEGKCDTMYSVNTIQSHEDQSSSTMIVTKTVDLNSCEQRPKIKTNFQFMQPCPECTSYQSQDKSLQSSTVLRYQIRGKRDKFLVESVQMSNDHVFAPQNKDENSAVVTIRASLRLINSQEASQQSMEMSDYPQTGQKVSDLIYSNELEQKLIRFQTLGDQHCSEEIEQMHGEQNKVAVFGEVLVKMVRHMRDSIDEKASRKFYKAVALARTLKESEIKAVHQQFFTRHQSQQITPEEREKIRNILPHIYAQAATLNSIRHLTEKIASGEISPIKATVLMPSIMNAAHVSKEMISTILRLEQSSVVQQSQMLKKALWLTVGSMMRTACSSSETMINSKRSSSSSEEIPMTRSSCSSDTEQQFVRIISERLRNSHSWEDKILFLRVLGNAGLESSIQEIERILSNKDQIQSSSIRMEAIMALRNLRQSLPQKTKSILLASALNKMESSAVRMAAIQQLLQENPGKLIIDQLISMVNLDSDRRVASFAYRLMKSLSQSKQPCYAEMNKVLRSAIKRVSRISASMPVSDVVFESMQDVDKKLGVDLFFLPFYSSDQVVPKFVRAGINQISRDQRIKNMLAIEMGSSGLSSIFNELLESTPGRQAGSMQYKLNVRRLAEKVQQGWSKTSSSQPKSWMALKLKNQDILLYTMNEKWLQQIFQSSNAEMITSLMSSLRSLSRWSNIDEATLLHESSIKIPTAIGSQLRIKTKMPAIFSMHGQVNTEMQGQGKGHVEVKGKCNAIVSMVTDISSRTAIFSNGIYLIRTAKASLPVDIAVDVDMAQQDDQLRVEIRQSESSKRDLFKLESRPVIYFKRSPLAWIESEEKTIVADKNTKMESFKQCMRIPMFGSETCIRGLISKPSCQHSKLLHYVSPWFGLNKVVISSNPTTSSSDKRVTFTGSVRRTSGSSSYSSDQQERSYRLTFSSSQSFKQSLDVQFSKRSDSFVPKQIKAHYSQHVEGQKSMELCMEMNSQSDSYSMTESSSDKSSYGSKKTKINAKLTWGSSQCQPDNYVQTTIEATVMPKMYRDQSRAEGLFENQQSTSTYLTTRDEPTSYKIQMKHNNVPKYLTKYGDSVLDLLTYTNYWNSQIQRFDSSSYYGQPQKQQQCNIQIVMSSYNKADIKIQTDRKKITMENVHIPSILRYEQLRRSNLIRLSNILISNHGQASCQIQENSIRTFDNAIYRMPFSDCYTILTRDDAGQFTVMAKRSKSQSDKKTVKVITPSHEIKIKPEHGTNSIYVDGRKVEGETFADPQSIEIIRSGHQASIELINQNVKIIFDGEQITIKTPETYHGQQQGMCGNLNADSSDDFGQSHFDQRKSAMQMWKQMTLADGNCQMPTEQTETEFEHSTLYDQYNDEDFENSRRQVWSSEQYPTEQWESSEQSEQPSRWRSSQDSLQTSSSLEIEDVLTEVMPIRQNRIVERSGQRCVSLRPVERCPEHSYVADSRQVQREVQYTCLSRKDPLLTQVLHRQRQGQFMDLSDRQISFSRRESIPRKCVAVV